MYVTKEKLITVFFILIAICLILAIGYFITGKNPLTEGLEPVDAKYDTNNYNVKYHDDIEDIRAQKGIYNTEMDKMLVRDNSGNLISMNFMSNSALPTYYQPGSFVFGSSNYVPNYEDSVYLSKTTQLSTLGKVYPSSSMMAGFCHRYKNDQIKLETECNKLSNDTCASVSCCVLMGGNKCVSGDEHGPTLKSNYTDPLVKDKDVYYYQGKCYGNCV